MTRLSYDSQGNPLLIVTAGQWVIEHRDHRRAPWKPHAHLTVPEGQEMTLPMHWDHDCDLIRTRAA